MHFVFLGHAAWLCELAGLRILFDPLLEGPHHGGVFEVFPRRRLEERELRADFIVVSHRHPDHFDVESLGRLAELDAESVVLTSDALVARSARALGFSNVRELATFDRVTLDAGELLTTPSFASEVEWGVMVAHDGALAWNQVDSVSGGPARLSETLALAARALGRPEPRAAIDLGIVRWQPLLEIEAQTGAAVSFPLDAYSMLLDEIALLEARAIVPGAAGSRHRDAHAAMNRIVYPLSAERFVRDAALRAPATRVLPAEIGARYLVERGSVERSGFASELVELVPSADDRAFRPLELPPLADPLGDPELEPQRFAQAAAWVERELAPALASAFARFGSERALVFTLELVGVAERKALSIDVDGSGARVRPEHDPEWDALVAIALSELTAVLAFEKSWGEPLLSGLLRMSLRAYDVGERGLRALPVGQPFLYYALSYDESVRRTTERRVSDFVRGRAERRP